SYGTSTPALVSTPTGTSPSGSDTGSTTTGGTTSGGTLTGGRGSGGTTTGGTSGSHPRMTSPVLTVTPRPAGPATTSDSGLTPDQIAAALAVTNNRPAAAVVQQSATPLTGQIVPMAPGTVTISVTVPSFATSRAESGGGDNDSLLPDAGP